MEKLVIQGGTSLNGILPIGGAKNAALPILFASILLETPVTFLNVPRLRDIFTTSSLLEVLGCETSFTGNQLVVTPKTLNPVAPYDLVKTMRASILCLGPLLARLGEARVALPGGCAIGARPVDLHLSALEKMGAVFELESGYVIGKCKKLHGAEIHFDFPTVGGTQNIIMAACLAEGTTVLENVAREPEIIDLVKFLRACGAKITGEGTSIIAIDGVPSLQGCTYHIMPDRIEAGTFLAAVGLTGGDVTLTNFPHGTLDGVLEKMHQMGIKTEKLGKDMRVAASGELKPIDIVTRPYPGFPTDMQAQMMALMCVANGASSVEETIFENRFMHVSELARMGADIKLSGSHALVRGVKRLTGAPVMASDLRASAALVVSGLAAKGETHVQRIYHLDRGYEQIEVRLSALGANIRRMKE